MQTNVESNYSLHPLDLVNYTQKQLYERLTYQLMQTNQAQLVYSHIDRLIIGSIVPKDKPFKLSSGEIVGTEIFFHRRELGVLLIKGNGFVVVDGQKFSLQETDGMYIGKDVQTAEFYSDDPNNPAHFYVSSTPSEISYPTRIIKRTDATSVTIGQAEKANIRTIYQYIHPSVCQSSLLLMGWTVPAPGSVWNTMPCHIHERRMEAYFYFNLDENDTVLKTIGQPEETKHLFLRNHQAVILPSWSIHMGVGTGPYQFIWSMTGENQEYNDVLPVQTKELR